MVIDCCFYVEKRGEKLNKELCKKCIHAKDAELHHNSVCEVCYQIDAIGHGENKEFIEKIEMPECCGKCKYCEFPPKNIFVKQSPYCDASGEFNLDDRRIQMQFIRKNYLTKNTPKWCPMGKE